MEWDLGEPPAGSSLTRAVTPAPSQVQTAGREGGRVKEAGRDEEARGKEVR